MLFAGSPGTTWRSRPAGRRPWATWPRAGGWTRPRPASSSLSTWQNPQAGSIRPRVRRFGPRSTTRDLHAHAAELTFGARVAWRNSSRCIGRLYWHSRCACATGGTSTRPRASPWNAVGHLRESATTTARSGRRSRCSPRTRPGGPGPRIWNEQLIRYAGYRRPDGTSLGDPRYADLTEAVRRHRLARRPGHAVRRAAPGGHRRATGRPCCPRSPATPCWRCR